MTSRQKYTFGNKVRFVIESFLTADTVPEFCKEHAIPEKRLYEWWSELLSACAYVISSNSFALRSAYNTMSR